MVLLYFRKVTVCIKLDWPTSVRQLTLLACICQITINLPSATIIYWVNSFPQHVLGALAPRTCCRGVTEILVFGTGWFNLYTGLNLSDNMPMTLRTLESISNSSISNNNNVFRHLDDCKNGRKSKILSWP